LGYRKLNLHEHGNEFEPTRSCKFLITCALTILKSWKILFIELEQWVQVPRYTSEIQTGILSRCRTMRVHNTTHQPTSSRDAAFLGRFAFMIKYNQKTACMLTNRLYHSWGEGHTQCARRILINPSCNIKHRLLFGAETVAILA